MRAGTMRERIVVERFLAVDDPRWGNALAGGWTTIGEFYADVRPVSAREQIERGVQTEFTHAIRMRYTPDISSKDRILWRERTLDVVGVIDVGNRRQELELTCREHPAEGAAA